MDFTQKITTCAGRFKRKNFQHFSKIEHPISTSLSFKINRITQINFRCFFSLHRIPGPSKKRRQYFFEKKLPDGMNKVSPSSWTKSTNG